MAPQTTKMSKHAIISTSKQSQRTTIQDFRNFSENRLHTLFSKGRILSYDSINQHFDNFKLIASISKNIGIAEILLRNKIDSIMCMIDSA